ncbi:hypothetical protein RFI_27887 [Reticulomyxa filosa]|uniref:Uncharacterized protein n=1 Tax=Reticulomyxa filosa TaxID=46433 RepID=X6M785_RETFI|nr:hypothetical protein RFI_27887 [Reticulomyxa filosa]|eukprot:ETO09491.1 hypothetical protein RFI_27887 [Reticulomyxa filosa]
MKRELTIQLQYNNNNNDNKKNVIESMKALALNSEILAKQGKQTRVKEESEELRKIVTKMDDHARFGVKECEMFEKLWNDEGIQRTYEYRDCFQLIDTMKYLMTHMRRFSQPNFVPTFEDLLHSRKRSSGVHNETFMVTNDINQETEVLEIYDVGGQRNERSKWVNFFDHCHAIIFVASLSEYNQALWEDNTQNRMAEALALFRQIIDLEDFRHSHTILFLNKSDLFREKIQKFPLSDYFQHYKGKDKDFEDGIDFLKQEFANQRNNKDKLLYIHVTCATDPKNVTNLFSSMRNIVIRNSLKQSEHKECPVSDICWVFFFFFCIFSPKLFFQRRLHLKKISNGYCNHFIVGWLVFFAKKNKYKKVVLVVVYLLSQIFFKLHLGLYIVSIKKTNV